jgi:hypothetical protein
MGYWKYLFLEEAIKKVLYRTIKDFFMISSNLFLITMRILFINTA